MKYTVELEEKQWDIVVESLGFMSGRIDAEQMVKDRYKGYISTSELQKIFKEIQKAVGKDMS